MNHNADPRLVPYYQTEDATLFLDYTALDYLPDGVFLHLEINSWSISKYKFYLKVWEKAKQKLKEEGHKTLYATAPPGMPEKLIKMFGLEDTGLVSKGFKIMRIKLCHN